MPTLLDAELVGDALTRLTGWAGGASGISRTLSMTEMQYGDFIERVKITSDAMNHHADISRNGEQVYITLVTHSAGGVTEYDIALASRINDLARIAKGEAQAVLPPEAFGKRGRRGGAASAGARAADAADLYRDTRGHEVENRMPGGTL